MAALDLKGRKVNLVRMPLKVEGLLACEALLAQQVLAVPRVSRGTMV